MRVFTLNELFRMTRNELFGLHRDITATIAALPDTAPERPAAFANLRTIRAALARPNLSPQ